MRGIYLFWFMWICTILIAFNYSARKDREYKDNKLTAKIDSLHTIQMDSLDSISKRVDKYNEKIDISMLDFLRAETLTMMEKQDD